VSLDTVRPHASLPRCHGKTTIPFPAPKPLRDLAAGQFSPPPQAATTTREPIPPQRGHGARRDGRARTSGSLAPNRSIRRALTAQSRLALPLCPMTRLSRAPARLARRHSDNLGCPLALMLGKKTAKCNPARKSAVDFDGISNISTPP